MIGSSCRLVALAVMLALFDRGRAFGQDGRNVLLLVNAADAGSGEVAAYYARARAVPAEQLLPLRIATADEIDRVQYERDIEVPVARWLSGHNAQDRILYLVPAKGFPLRVRGSGGQSGTVASVDSELALLYRKLTGTPTPPAGRAANPYFLGDRPITAAGRFSHAHADIFLVTRLDGFSVADVRQLIDRAREPSRDGEFVLDERASLLGERRGDTWLAAAARELEARGFGDRVVLETSRALAGTRKRVLGFYWWGSNDPAVRTRSVDLQFAPGAIAGAFVSTDARTFREPPSSWTIGNWSDQRTFYEGSPQSLIGDLIRAGITGVAGHVSEPYLDASVRPQILFPAYVSGFNLAESFYLAMPYLSWQTVVVGDPLCAPFRTAQLSTGQADPPLDPETGSPGFFSARRVTQLITSQMTPDAARLIVQAETRLAHQDQAGARDSLERATAADSRVVFAHRMLATLYEQAGDYDRAIARYRTVLAALPDDVASLNNLAYALAVHKKAPAVALPLAQRAYELSKRDAAIADTLGWVHYLLGQRAQAEQLLLEAKNGAPALAEVRIHLAQLYASTDRPDLARAELKIAIERRPALKDAPEVLQLEKTLAAQ